MLNFKGNYRREENIKLNIITKTRIKRQKLEKFWNFQKRYGKITTRHVKINLEIHIMNLYDHDAIRLKDISRDIGTSSLHIFDPRDHYRPLLLLFSSQSVKFQWQLAVVERKSRGVWSRKRGCDSKTVDSVCMDNEKGDGKKTPAVRSTRINKWYKEPVWSRVRDKLHS